jgi:hypothetical protein
MEKLESHVREAFFNFASDLVVVSRKNSEYSQVKEKEIRSAKSDFFEGDLVEKPADDKSGRYMSSFS